VTARLVGVYDADGGVVGELSYFIGKRLGRAHCALCDITHGTVREKEEWQACRRDLSLPFVAVHRNEVPAAVAAAVDVAPPYVALEDGGVVTVLLDGDDLEACAASPAALVEALRHRLPPGDSAEEGGVADGEA
jgi:hypothetical protein